MGAHRLGESTPYLLPADGVLTLFLCRWPEDRPVPVSLPPDATPEERRWLGAVLGAWEGAGLGLRFAPASGGEGIAIRFVDRVEPGETTPRAAQTGADCAVAPAAARTNPDVAVLPAQLVTATVEILRFGRNVLGKDVPYSDEELAGATLHELGHALGFQGHSTRDDTIMTRSVDAARRAGRRVLAGKEFHDDTLRALYALPSGVVVRRVALPGGRTESFDRMVGIAAVRDLTGPFVRVGDRGARFAWLGPGGEWYRIFAFGLRGALRDPATFELFPMADAWGLLAEPTRP